MKNSTTNNDQVRSELLYSWTTSKVAANQFVGRVYASAYLDTPKEDGSHLDSVCIFEGTFTTRARAKNKVAKLKVQLARSEKARNEKLNANTYVNKAVIVSRMNEGELQQIVTIWNEEGQISSCTVLGEINEHLEAWILNVNGAAHGFAPKGWEVRITKRIGS